MAEVAGSISLNLGQVDCGLELLQVMPHPVYHSE